VKADSSSDGDGHDDDDDDDDDDDGQSAEAAAASDSQSELIPQQYTSSTDTPLSAEVKSDDGSNFTFEIK
jgi:hypothetical protein